MIQVQYIENKITLGSYWKKVKYKTDMGLFNEVPGTGEICSLYRTLPWFNDFSGIENNQCS